MTTTYKPVYKRPKLLKEAHFHYCPGCGHGIINRLLMEVIEEMDLAEEAICVAPAGCGMLLYNYFNIDVIESAHGRGSAVATGIKRVLPDKLVFSYQGDGDLAAIGTAEIIHAAHRAEQLTVVFINNAVFGMTGGQMAPTTMLGQITATTPYGRNSANHGYPLNVSELLAVLPGAIYIERCGLCSPAHIRKAKAALKHAFELQINNAKGLSLVELLSPCPTYWRLSPPDAMLHIQNEMTKVFPLGRLKG